MTYLDPHIGDDEQLTNYVVESNKFKVDISATGGTRVVLHWKAFKPGPDGERSLFRKMDDLPRDAIAELGRVFVAQPRNKPLLGWGVISARSVRTQPRIRLRADEPPPRHAVVDQWPDDDGELKTIAMLLASASVGTTLP